VKEDDEKVEHAAVDDMVEVVDEYGGNPAESAA